MRQEQMSRFGVIGFSAFALMSALSAAQADELGSPAGAQGQGLKWHMADGGGQARSGLSMQLAQAQQDTQPPPTPVADPSWWSGTSSDLDL